jgi:uncharacterized protein (UPF0261 family)
MTCSSLTAALPPETPKVIVSPLASGSRRFGPFVSAANIFVFHTIVDILGVNAFTRTLLDQAAAALAGLLDGAPYLASHRVQLSFRNI